MKLDTRNFKHLSQEDWRVLTAVALGSKNHEVVPTSLINQLSALRTGLNGCHKCISNLAKAGLIAKLQNTKYDGYRLTFGGFDYLALRSHTRNGSILHLGSQMGVGKESDIYLVTTPSTGTSPSSAAASAAPPRQSILKIHRLGRTSFRSIRNNRAYHGTRAHCSWQYLSRLSAAKEFAAMRALHAAGFPVPEPIAHNRHTVVMSLVPGMPLRQVPLSSFAGGVEDVAALYGELMELTLQLASVGLIHGDFNEFNILLSNLPDPDSLPDFSTAEVREDSQHSTATTPTATPKIKPHIIDFPQITSMSHPQAASYFARDVTCIKTFFRKRYHFEATDSDGPSFADAQARLEQATRLAAAASVDTESTLPSVDAPHGPTDNDTEETAGEEDAEADTNIDVTSDLHIRPGRLDVQIEAMGFNRKMARQLENALLAERELDIDRADLDETRGDAKEDEENEYVEDDEGHDEEGDDELAKGEGEVQEEMEIAEVSNEDEKSGINTSGAIIEGLPDISSLQIQQQLQHHPPRMKTSTTDVAHGQTGRTNGTAETAKARAGWSI